MKRTRWLSAKWPVSIRTLGSRMKAERFTPESFDGFFVEKIRENSLDGHFIEKLAYQETTIDPFGKEEISDRVEYRKLYFALYSEFPNIELRDSQRSSREFINKLLELCNFSLTVTPISVDLMQWVQAFQAEINQNIVVDSVQVRGMVIEDGVTAKILLRGEKDVRGALLGLCGLKKFTLEKLQVKIKSGSQFIPIQFSNAAAVKIPTDSLDDLLPILRRTLPKPKP